MDNLEGTVQLPLHSYEELKKASQKVELVTEAKMGEIKVLSDKNDRLEREKEQFEMIISVWTKWCMGGKDIANVEYGKKLRKLADSFNDQGLVVAMHVDEKDGKFYVTPINKAETLEPYED